MSQKKQMFEMINNTCRGVTCTGVTVSYESVGYIATINGKTDAYISNPVKGSGIGATEREALDKAYKDLYGVMESYK